MKAAGGRKGANMSEKNLKSEREEREEKGGG